MTGSLSYVKVVWVTFLKEKKKMEFGRVIFFVEMLDGTGNCMATLDSAATFYSASFSKPNPVWFGKLHPKNA